MHRTFIRIAVLSAALITACGGTAPGRVSQPTPESAGRGSPQTQSSPAPSGTADGSSATSAVAGGVKDARVDLSDVEFSTSGWKTDFRKHSVPLSEISSGGPPRDGIPPIDHPKFASIEDADGWLKPREPVIHLSVGGEVRAYPLQILIWHEIVNDTVGGIPVAVTFCPLCNTAIAFDRRLGSRTLDFGTTGNLRKSDLVMWDRQTESWWQQVTGEAIVGELTGQKLEMLPATIVSWQEFRDRFPEGKVLSRETGHQRSYGTNPYAGYDKADEPPFLFDGELDGRLPPKERVVTVSLGGEDAAYPFSLLAKERVVSDTVGRQPIVVFFNPGTASALDASTIADSRDVGSAAVYSRVVDGRELNFRWQDGAFVDDQTSSHWTLLGRAESGTLAGKQLQPVVSGNHFWFAWAAFKPQTRIYGATKGGDSGPETDLFPAAALGPLPSSPPPLPLVTKRDTDQSGSQIEWSDDRHTWATGIYKGRVLGIAVCLYDSPRRSRVVGQVLHRSRIQVLRHQEGAPGYYLVRSLEMDPVQQGWLPAPLVTFQRPPGLSAPACAGKLCVHPPGTTQDVPSRGIVPVA